MTKNRDIRILANRDFVNTEDNLIYKVAFFIQQQYNVKYGVSIELTKRIPVAAGLGGGSSDAAATIKAVSALWRLDLSQDAMHEIASRFGSDINFFLDGGTSLGVGRGEKLSPQDDLDVSHIFLVNPGFGIPSREAYGMVEDMHPEERWKNLLQTHDMRYAFNRLQMGICKAYPEIMTIIRHLENNGAEKAILSGSGPTIIGFCPDRATAESLSEFYSNQGYWNYITKTKRRTR